MVFTNFRKWGWKAISILIFENLESCCFLPLGPQYTCIWGRNIPNKRCHLETCNLWDLQKKIDSSIPFQASAVDNTIYLHPLIGGHHSQLDNQCSDPMNISKDSRVGQLTTSPPHLQASWDGVEPLHGDLIGDRWWKPSPSFCHLSGENNLICKYANRQVCK